MLAYSATTLQQTGAWCSSPNGVGGGAWISGAGIAAEVDSGGNPRAFVATGYGTYDASLSPNQDYGDSIVRLSLTNGAPAVSDYFTPFNQQSLNNGGQDLGSGGVLLLPNQPASHPHLLVQVGKQGRVYLLDRDQMTNNDSHYCNGCSSDPEIVQAIDNAVGGMWSMPAYGTTPSISGAAATCSRLIR